MDEYIRKDTARRIIDSPRNREQMLAILEDTPSEDVQQWIPCSEITADGYPNEDGTYYVTERNYGFYLDADFKQIVAHTSQFKNGDFVDRFYDSNYSNITAWMPLPWPYKDGE